MSDNNANHVIEFTDNSNLAFLILPQKKPWSYTSNKFIDQIKHIVALLKERYTDLYIDLMTKNKLHASIHNIIGNDDNLNNNGNKILDDPFGKLNDENTPVFPITIYSPKSQQNKRALTLLSKIPEKYTNPSNNNSRINIHTEYYNDLDDLFFKLSPPVHTNSLLASGANTVSNIYSPNISNNWVDLGHTTTSSLGKYNDPSTRINTLYKQLMTDKAFDKLTAYVVQNFTFKNDNQKLRVVKFILHTKYNPANINCDETPNITYMKTLYTLINYIDTLVNVINNKNNNTDDVSKFELYLITKNNSQENDAKSMAKNLTEYFIHLKAKLQSVCDECMHKCIEPPNTKPPNLMNEPIPTINAPTLSPSGQTNTTPPPLPSTNIAKPLDIAAKANAMVLEPRKTKTQKKKPDGKQNGFFTKLTKGLKRLTQKKKKGIFFERQKGLLCAKHAINNVIGEEMVIYTTEYGMLTEIGGKANIYGICKTFNKKNQCTGNYNQNVVINTFNFLESYDIYMVDSNEPHILHKFPRDDKGNYNGEIILDPLTQADINGKRLLGFVFLDSKYNPLSPDRRKYIAGDHYVAYKFKDNKVYYLDSVKENYREVSINDLLRAIKKQYTNPATNANPIYAITSSDDAKHSDSPQLTSVSIIIQFNNMKENGYSQANNRVNAAANPISNSTMTSMLGANIKGENDGNGNGNGNRNGNADTSGRNDGNANANVNASGRNDGNANANGNNVTTEELENFYNVTHANDIVKNIDVLILINNIRDNKSNVNIVSKYMTIEQIRNNLDKYNTDKNIRNEFKRYWFRLHKSIINILNVLEKDETDENYKKLKNLLKRYDTTKNIMERYNVSIEIPKISMAETETEKRPTKKRKRNNT